MTDQHPLKTAIQSPRAKQQLILECVLLIEQEVGRKKGFSGTLIKAAYKAMQKIHPKATHMALDSLLPDFVGQIDPFISGYFKDRTRSSSLEHYFSLRCNEIADCLLSITDSKASQSDTAGLLMIYKNLRPSAKKHVLEAIPAIAERLESYLGPEFL